MEVIVIGALLLLAFCLAIAPCMLVWLGSYLWLPKKYKLPPYKMTSLCVLLAIATSIALNVELEGGVGSAPIAILALSFLWALILLPAISFCKYIIYVAQRRKT